LSASPAALESICVFCGSSDAAPASWRAAAASLGRAIAGEGMRLVYGGGGFGLMGETARAARSAGGRVLGVIPDFLVAAEGGALDTDTVVVRSMHERKLRMFEEADAFAILPGAIGTLEEAVELLSWRRLGLHTKPIVFFNPDQFWTPLYALFQSFIDSRLLPAEFDQCWRAVTNIADALPTLRAMPRSAFSAIPAVRTLA
jgi:hypothetical protein